MTIEIQPKKTFRLLLFLILFLLTANIAGIVLRTQFPRPGSQLAFQLFDFDKEKNVPTLYSSIALASCAVLLGAIATIHKKSGGSHLPWLGLAFIFVFLSIDETATVHEKLSVMLQARWNTSGFFYYAWVIPYGLALLILLGFYFRFLMRLPRQSRFLFLLSGAIYICGAIGFDMIYSNYHDLFRQTRFLGAFFYTVEDLFEMFGIALFIYSLLLYIRNQFGEIQISIGKSET